MHCIYLIYYYSYFIFNQKHNITDLKFIIKKNVLQRVGKASASKDSWHQGGWDHAQVPPGGGLAVGLVDLGLRDPLGLGAPVLKPDLNLGLR